MSRSKSKLATKEEIIESIAFSKLTHSPGSYTDHISFFFDPIPSDIIGNLYKGLNDVWKNGNILIEHITDTRMLESEILFSLVESPADVSSLDSIDWVDTDEFLLEYKIKKEARKRNSGETGNGILNLENQIKKYKGSTTKAYIAASKRKDFLENITKYAASVPHLMLYPKRGFIEIEYINKVVIGSNIRKPVTISKKTLINPLYSTW